MYDTEAGLNIDGSTEVPAFPYAILTVSSPVKDTDRFVQARERNELDFTVGSHGLNPESARWVASRVGRLAGSSPVVAGWTAVVESVTSSPVRPDRDNPEQTVYSGSDGFTAYSYPA